MPQDESRVSRAKAVFLPLVCGRCWEPISPLGVQLFEAGPAAIDRVAQSGASWARIGLNWARIEPVNTTPGYYQWPGEFDEQLAALGTAKINVILTVHGNPSWAATFPAGPIDKVGIGELVQFVRAAVARYSEAPYRVKYWEFYNEPDNGDELFADEGWGVFGYEPEAYVEILKAVYEPIKREDPRAQVVLGGLAYDAWAPNGPFVEEFLDNVLALGGGAYFDLMNFHYYPAWARHWAPYGIDIIGKANYLRAKMAAFGVNKPLICTEAGTFSNGNGGEEIQSQYVAKVAARSMAAQLNPMIWFTLADESSLESYQFGLLDSQLNPKPAYAAYQTVVKQLLPTRYVRTLSESETASTQIEAYEFQVVERPARIVVAWTNDGAARSFTVQAETVVKADKFGSETVLQDGDDGRDNGRVVVTLDSSPVFLRYEP